MQAVALFSIYLNEHHMPVAAKGLCEFCITTQMTLQQVYHLLKLGKAWLKFELLNNFPVFSHEFFVPCMSLKIC